MYAYLPASPRSRRSSDRRAGCHLLERLRDQRRRHDRQRRPANAVVELGASTRQLQWIVDAYLLVFTGLLLAAGGLGDRYGRETLSAGLVVFATDLGLRRRRDSANELIVAAASWESVQR